MFNEKSFATFYHFRYKIVTEFVFFFGEAVILNYMCKFFKLLLLFYVILSHQMDTFRFILILSSLSSVTYNVLDDNFIFYSKMYLYNNEILILLNKLPNDK